MIPHQVTPHHAQTSQSPEQSILKKQRFWLIIQDFRQEFYITWDFKFRNDDHKPSLALTMLSFLKLCHVKQESIHFNINRMVSM